MEPIKSEDLDIEVIDGSNQHARILVVDDNESNRALIGQLLRRRGFEVEYAESGLEAVQRVRTNTPDLVLLDIMMPRLSGVDTLVRMRERFSPLEMPIIMVSARNEISMVVESMVAGANDYLTKPIQTGALIARMELWLSVRRRHKQSPGGIASLFEARATVIDHLRANPSEG